MGERLRGVSPPFTPSGTAAILRSRTGNYRIGRPTIGAHTGLLLRWRAERGSALSLLPAPLEASPGSDVVTCFLNVTQTGLNLFRPETDGESNAALRSVDPLHVNWHEAIFFLRCTYEGRPTRYTYVIYKDVDHGVLLGVANGYHTKLASFHTRFPLAEFPDRAMRIGSILRMTASRFDELVIDASFRAEREVPQDEIRKGIGTFWLASTVGIRYFADALGSGRPLVHDIVLREQRAPQTPEDVPASITSAWAGVADVTIGTSEREELSLLAPIEMLDAYFIHLPTLSGPRTQTGIAMTRVLHDYVARER